MAKSLEKLSINHGNIPLVYTERISITNVYTNVGNLVTVAADNDQTYGATSQGNYAEGSYSPLSLW